MKTRTLSYAFIALLASNNLLWLSASRGTADPAANRNEPPNAACAQNPPGHDKSPLAYGEIVDIETPAAQNSVKASARLDIAADIETGAIPLSPGLDTSTTDMPQEASQNYLYQHYYNRNYYYSTGNQTRLDTIQSLTPQGDDLSLIKKIVQTEEEAGLRAAAVSKLAYQHSYAATSILLDALDDPTTEVRFAALNTIIKNGDRTLVPLLREKMEAMPDGSIRTEMAQSIRQLEYSVTMQMDALPRE